MVIAARCWKNGQNEHDSRFKGPYGLEQGLAELVWREPGILNVWSIQPLSWWLHSAMPQWINSSQNERDKQGYVLTKGSFAKTNGGLAGTRELLLSRRKLNVHQISRQPIHSCKVTVVLDSQIRTVFHQNHKESQHRYKGQGSISWERDNWAGLWMME